MAFIVNDRVKETTSTTGTGAVTLAGASSGFDTFAAGIGGSNVTYYTIAHQAVDEWEVGVGTLNGGASTLTRTQVISSSNSDAAVSFAVGTKDVFCTLPAGKIATPEAEAYGSSANPILINVTVATKSAYHPYSGTGSSNGYLLNGMESPAFKFTGADSGKKYYYKFDQSDSSNSGHPLLFYLEADKTTAYTTGVTASGTPGSANAYTQILVDANTPNILYYQCSSHGYMGNFVKNVGNDFNGDVNFRGNASFADSKKIKLGTSDDLEIYHDASNSIIEDTGTGDLLLRSNSYVRLQSDTGENMLYAQPNGEVTLYHNNANKLSTTATGVQTVGTLNINAEYAFPTTDGTANQILETDGSGALTFVAKPTSGASAGFAIAMAVAL